VSLVSVVVVVLGAGERATFYLLASFGATTATGLSELLEGEVSHDQVTRYLAGTKKTATDLWRTVKPFVREVQSEAGVLIIDDSIEEKPYTDENDIICWHYDHSKDRMLKGINFLTALYSSQGVSVPVGFHLVAKTEKYIDPKTQKEKRRSSVSKNEVCQELIKQAVTNRIPFRFVLFDVWFASAETLVFLKHQQHRDFICPLKINRKVALSVADKHQGRYTRVDTLEWEAYAAKIVYLEGVDFPLVLVKQVFTNEDGSRGIRYLVSSDPTLSFADLTTTYHERWGVECYHKSLKQNVSLAKSPTQTVTTQTNHFFAALCGFLKLERLKGKTKLNHFALKTKLYLTALHSAFSTLRQLTPVPNPA
jgi:DDE superfamily endonuclease